jgi:hypothetical protein
MLAGPRATAASSSARAARARPRARRRRHPRDDRRPGLLGRAVVGADGSGSHVRRRSCPATVGSSRAPS